MDGDSGTQDNSPSPTISYRPGLITDVQQADDENVLPVDAHESISGDVAEESATPATLRGKPFDGRSAIRFFNDTHTTLVVSCALFDFGCLDEDCLVPFVTQGWLEIGPGAETSLENATRYRWCYHYAESSEGHTWSGATRLLVWTNRKRRLPLCQCGLNYIPGPSMRVGMRSTNLREYGKIRYYIT